MTTNDGIQVANKVEEEQVQFINRIMQTLQDAANAPALRKELEVLRTECEGLKRQKADLEIEIQLERDERARFANLANEHQQKVNTLNAQLSSLQHKFDTISGVVASAMAEIEAAKPKPQPVIVNPSAQGEPTPWTPSQPLRSAS